MGVPPQTTVTLNVARYDVDNPGADPTLETVDQTLSDKGGFRFEGVRARRGDSVFVTASYGGILQGSLVGQVTDTQTELILSFLIYETTRDPNVITLTNAEYTLDFDVNDIMQVLGKFYFRNNSDRLYLSDTLDKNQRPVSVTVPLPVGARAIAFNSQIASRFTIGGDDILPIVQDTKPVIPGESHEVIFSYHVPYDRGAAIDQDYPFNTAQVAILIPKDTAVRLVGEFSGATSPAEEGRRQFNQYVTKNPVKAGERLVYTIEGIPPIQQDTPTVRTNPDLLDTTPLLIFGLGVITLMAVILGLLRGRRR